ncbi:MAG: Gfo/Idh/MocA family protein [Candidatus Dormibacteria bacterium]
MTRALILGCGSIGSRHARNLSSLGVDVSVCDVDPVSAVALADELGLVPVAREDPRRYDIVVVATPTSQHIDDLEWALTREADVFVEKPLASSQAGLARARALAGRLGDRVVMVGCNLRFSEGYRALAANLSAVGRPAVLLVDYGWWLPAWRPGHDYREQYSARRSQGGGIVLDAIHEIDYALELAGPAADVRSRCATSGVLDLDVEDVADIVITHRGGAHSHIHLDYLRRRPARSCTVIGSEAEITWDVPRGVVELIRASGGRSEPLAVGVDADRNLQYVAEMRHMLTAVATRGATCNDIARAAQSVDVALAALGEVDL